LYAEAKLHYSKALVLNPSLKVARTGMEATGVLASIFQPSKKAQTGNLAAPEPVIAKETPPEEFENRVQSAPSPPLENPTVDPLPSQKEHFAGIKVSYEVQVASFRDRKNAIQEANGLQKSGFRATLRSWSDKKGNEWYPLVVGPFMTREEALAIQSEIERRMNLSAIIKSRNGDAEAGKLLVHDQSGPIKSANLPKDAGVEISNGNGVNGMAGRVGNFLRTKGLKVIRLTNANNFAYAGTNIFYQKGYYEAADRVARELEVLQNIQEITKFDRPNVKIRVLVGKDITPHSKIFKDRQQS